jgi:hypothetical protein
MTPKRTAEKMVAEIDRLRAIPDVHAVGVDENYDKHQPEIARMLGYGRMYLLAHYRLMEDDDRRKKVWGYLLHWCVRDPAIIEKLEWMRVWIKDLRWMMEECGDHEYAEPRWVEAETGWAMPSGFVPPDFDGSDEADRESQLFERSGVPETFDLCAMEGWFMTIMERAEELRLTGEGARRVSANAPFA